MAYMASPLHRLPSGRHRLSREAVQQSQRSRLLIAIVQVIAEKGYAATTVADIVERAAVSRSTFYEQFADKGACFLAAFSFAVEYVIGRMAEARRALGDELEWRAHVRSDLATYLSVLASESDFAVALHVEVLAAGPAALEHRARMLERFSARTAAVHQLARRQQPELPPLPREAFALHTGGVDELIRDWLRTEAADRLPELLEPVLAATLALFGGSPATTA
jgi:AcrR family transcriptional regulator